MLVGSTLAHRSHSIAVVLLVMKVADTTSTTSTTSPKASCLPFRPCMCPDQYRPSYFLDAGCPSCQCRPFSDDDFACEGRDLIAVNGMASGAALRALLSDCEPAFKDSLVAGPEPQLHVTARPSLDEAGCDSAVAALNEFVIGNFTKRHQQSRKPGLLERNGAFLCNGDGQVVGATAELCKKDAGVLSAAARSATAGLFIGCTHMDSTSSTTATDTNVTTITSTSTTNELDSNLRYANVSRTESNLL